ncbi:MAG: zinc ribbon domain-containing protein [Anaerolineales bacterium]|nr:zinc ribbon domain-containing protein [Anaerolineales bacterium]
MNSIAILIGLGMLGISIPFVIRPYRQKHTKNANKTNTHAQVEESRVAALSALRDLDFDYKIGKVIEEDYMTARAQLLAEAAQYIQQQEQEDDRLEALIQNRRSSKDANCEECGTFMEAGQRFCAKCGKPVNSAACPSCGKKIRAGDLFCPSCGSRFEACTEEPRQSAQMEAVDHS